MAKNTNSKILYEFIEELDTPVRIVNKDNVIIYLNKTMITLFGNLLGEDADIIFSSDKKGSGHVKRKTTKKMYMGEALYQITSYPVRVDDEKDVVVEVFRDVTEQIKIEAQVKNNYNKLLKETQFAQRIQYSVLPINDKYWDMIDISAEYLPADDLGGDMFDIVKLNDHEVLMYVADVAGHGIRAALLTIFLREVVRGLSSVAEQDGLDVLLEKLLAYYAKLDIDSEMYFSILLCKYNKNTQEMSISNAGHNCYPLILRKNGRIEEVPVKGMPITNIGISPGYEEEIIGMYPGDRVLLYTDGIIEEYSEEKGTEFGVVGLRNVVGESFNLSGEDLSKKIIIEAEKHSRTKAKDDRAIMVATII